MPRSLMLLDTGPGGAGTADSMNLTDTHCHLDFSKFDSDRNSVLERAVQAGVRRILIPGLTLNSSLSVIKVAESSLMLYAAIGVHPTEAGTWTDTTQKHLTSLVSSHPHLVSSRGERVGRERKIVAIGEIGLDYYWDAAPHDLQQCVMKEQLDIAAELELPVIIHFRENALDTVKECASDLLKILEIWVTGLKRDQNPLAKSPGVLHSFSGTLELAHAVLSLGFFLGVAGPITYKKNHQQQELIASLPLDRLLLETDAPFQTPHPHRGKRNEPSYVRLIADKIACVHSDTTENVAKVTSENASRLFTWEE